MATSSENNAVVFVVAAGSSHDAGDVQQVATTSLPSMYSVVTATNIGSKTYLFAYDPSLTTADIFECTGSAPYLAEVNTKLTIGKAKDKLNVFTLGNQVYLSVYTANSGVFQIYSVAADLSLSKPYEFYRNHELALSQNFSTLKFFTQFGQVVALGYRDDGYVTLYTVGVVAISYNGVPPLLMTPVWSHMWAPGWTRFAFFQLGGETFFLKTNLKKLNVNIDHVLDSLSAGTAEVGTLLQNQLPDALKLTNVEPVLLGNADPWFVTYNSTTGASNLNRIHSDCLGWTVGASFNAPTGKTTLTPVTVGDKVFFVYI